MQSFPSIHYCMILLDPSPLFIEFHTILVSLHCTRIIFFNNRAKRQKSRVNKVRYHQHLPNKIGGKCSSMKLDKAMIKLIHHEIMKAEKLIRLVPTSSLVMKAKNLNRLCEKILTFSTYFFPHTKSDPYPGNKICKRTTESISKHKSSTQIE